LPASRCEQVACDQFGHIKRRTKTGLWEIGACFNREELIYRIRSIAKMKSRIHRGTRDGQILKAGIPKGLERTLIYPDPPYYAKGRDLYLDFYQCRDHEKVRFVIGKWFGRNGRFMR